MKEMDELRMFYLALIYPKSTQKQEKALLCCTTGSSQGYARAYVNCWEHLRRTLLLKEEKHIAANNPEQIWLTSSDVTESIWMGHTSEIPNPTPAHPSVPHPHGP